MPMHGKWEHWNGNKKEKERKKEKKKEKWK